jgi:DNA-directed RNA polymerase subunit A"
MSHVTRNKRQKIENGSTLSLLNLLEIKYINKAIEVSKCIIHDKPILYTEHIEEEYDKKKISRKITHLAKKCEIVKNAICKFNDVLQATIVISMNWHLPLTSFQENLEKLLRVKDESLITHGDSVGIIAAQSCSERFTQACLNTFHSSGAKKSATVGIRRINELLDATKILSTPLLSDIKTKHGNKFIGKTLEEISEECGILYEPSDDNHSSFVCFFKILPEYLDFNRPTSKNVRFDENHNLIKFVYPKSKSLNQIKSEYHKESNRHVYGLKGAEYYDDEEETLFFKKRDSLSKNVDFGLIDDIDPKVDLLKVKSNDIYYIADTFGVAAAETYLVKEIMRVLGAEGININIRHIQLIAANMCVNGEILPNKFNGVDAKTSVIRKATFEQATSTFSSAAAYGLDDTLDDISAQILIGNNISTGTTLSYINDVRPVVEKRFDQNEFDNMTVDAFSPEYMSASDDDNESHYYPTSPMPYICSPINNSDIIEPEINI